jgi:hypothetical protein
VLGARQAQAGASASSSATWFAGRSIWLLPVLEGGELEGTHATVG